MLKCLQLDEGLSEKIQKICNKINKIEVPKLERTHKYSIDLSKQNTLSDIRTTYKKQKNRQSSCSRHKIN